MSAAGLPLVKTGGLFALHTCAAASTLCLSQPAEEESDEEEPEEESSSEEESEEEWVGDGAGDEVMVDQEAAPLQQHPVAQQQALAPQSPQQPPAVQPAPQPPAVQPAQQPQAPQPAQQLLML